MTFDELIATSRAPEKFAKFIDCYKTAQANDFFGVRSNLPMRSFAPLMSNITLVERETTQLLSYRIAGDNIVNRMGFNPMGRNAMDFLTPDTRPLAVALHQQMFGQPCGSYIVYENEYETGRRMTTETLTLPMRKSELADPNLLLSFHVHHQATGTLSPKNKMTLAVNFDAYELIDIGCGIE